jgi:hypothetical protein
MTVKAGSKIRTNPHRHGCTAHGIIQEKHTPHIEQDLAPHVVIPDRLFFFMDKKEIMLPIQSVLQSRTALLPLPRSLSTLSLLRLCRCGYMGVVHA